MDTLAVFALVAALLAAAYLIILAYCLLAGQPLLRFRRF